MAIRVTMTIGLKDDAGVGFGTLTKVSDRHLQVEIDAQYDRGQPLEFQFALEGWRTSVQGQAAVIRVSPHELSHGPTTYALKIVSLADGKEAVYRNWLYEIAQGGGASVAPHPDATSSVISRVDRASRRAEGEQRLRALERQREARRNHSVVSSIAGSGATSDRPGVGRQALRSALQGFAGRSGDERSTTRTTDPTPSHTRGSAPPPSRPPASTAPPSRPPRRAAPWREELSVPPSSISRTASERRRTKRLDIRVAPDASPPRVEARFHDPKRFLSQYRDHLDRDVLFLRHDGLDIAVGRQVRVRLLLPTDDAVVCDAKVATTLPSGMGLLLFLDDDERSLLRRTAARLLRERR
jgi:hypothetical protein